MVAVAMVAVALAWMVHPGAPQAVKATSSDPKVATRQEKALHGVLWGMSYEQARETARREGRPILVFFSGVNDANCRVMESHVLPRADVVPLLSRFVTVQLYVDYQPIRSLKMDQRVMIAEHHQELELTLVNERQLAGVRRGGCGSAMSSRRKSESANRRSSSRSSRRRNPPIGGDRGRTGFDRGTSGLLLASLSPS